MPTKFLIAIALFFALIPAFTHAAPKPIRRLIWDEQQPRQHEGYSDKFLGQTIAEHLSKNPQLQIKTASLADPDQGLSPQALDNTDVIIWWSHVRHREVKWETADQIVDRIKANKLALITLHSAHWSSPFIRAMNARTIDDCLKTLPESDRAKAKLNLIYPNYTAIKRDTPLTPSFTKETAADGTITLNIKLPHCVFPAWRADAKPSHVTTLLPDHPIAKGLPKTWDVTHTEMYDEPFHIPAPDQIIFEEKWDAGEHFRTGMLWTVGQGKVFYFRPGHEQYGVYNEELPLKVLENATLWLAGQLR
jgi:trehalose utilization protein